MADTKITALTALTAADPANDVIPIVDVSDTTMAASGTTKKISVNNILSSSPTASGALTVTGLVTAGSATITGDLTVDTSTLKVDSANDRVGIGTASVAAYTNANLVIYGAANGIAAIANSTAYSSLQKNGTDLYLNTNVTGVGSNSGSFIIRHGSSFTEQFRIANDAVCTWSNVGGVAGTSMTLNATGLGVGVTPSAGKGALQLSSGINFPATQVASSDVNTLDDYKEAAFTPTIEGGTIAGIGTYSSQVGRYTKVGNLVTVQILIAWTAHTGTGNLSIANLPYTSSSVSGLVASATIGYVDGLALTAGNTPLAYIQNNSSKISLLQTPTGGGSVSLVPMDTAATIAINVTYMV